MVIDRCSWQVGHFTSGTGELEDVQAGVGAIGGVDVPAVVYVYVVGLDRDLALLARASADTAFVGFGRDRRDVEPDFLRVERIADVERAHAGVEVRDE